MATCSYCTAAAAGLDEDGERTCGAAHCMPVTAPLPAYEEVSAEDDEIENGDVVDVTAETPADYRAFRLRAIDRGIAEALEPFRGPLRVLNADRFGALARTYDGLTLEKRS